MSVNISCAFFVQPYFSVKINFVFLGRLNSLRFSRFMLKLHSFIFYLPKQEAAGGFRGAALNKRNCGPTIRCLSGRCHTPSLISTLKYKMRSLKFVCLQNVHILKNCLMESSVQATNLSVQIPFVRDALIPR